MDGREVGTPNRGSSVRRISRRRLLRDAGAAGVAAGAGMLFGPAVLRAAAQESAPAGVITVNDNSPTTFIRNFNPFSVDARWPTTYGIYEPLFIYNTVKNEIVPWLATGYTWGEGNKTLTFTTRDGVKWSDGQPFTASDVAFTFNLMKEHPDLVGTGGVWTYLSDVQATDAKTVVFTFDKVYTPGLYDIGQQNIVPEHIWKSVSDPAKFLNENPVATGPFTDVKVFRNQLYQVDRNPNYWQAGKPYIQGIRFPAISGVEAVSLALGNGEIDWAGAFVPDIEKTFIAKDPQHNHNWSPPIGDSVQFYVLTTKKPFDDPNVRKALSMAIQRDKVVNIAEYGYTTPANATGLSDAYKKWLDAEAVAAGDWVKHDVAKANQLLDAAGLKKHGDTRQLPDGTPMSYEVNVITGWNDWVSSCQIIAQNLKDVGIAATVKTYDFSAFIDRVRRGQFDMAIYGSVGGPTPFDFYRATMSSYGGSKPIGQPTPQDWHRYVNSEADKLLDQFAATSDFDEQKQIADQLQMLYVQNAPAMPLFPGPQWGQYSSKRFTGFPDQGNPYALLSPSPPERLIVLTTIKPVP